MKILFFKLEEGEKEYVKEQFGGEAVFVDEALDKDHIPAADADAEVISTFVNSMIDKQVLDAFSNLKMIATRSTGFDHIDMEECKRRNIVVSNVPAYGENTVAEYTFGLILALTRKIYHSYDRIRETGSFSLEGMRGIDLKGKTLGVVGTGSIGRNVVRIAKGFDMRVLACDVHADEEFANNMGFEYCAPERAMKESDILTLHVPYMPATHHLINSKNIGIMKQGAYLINTSRGQIVETEALVRALQDGRLGGVALDVLEEEGVVKDELELLLEGRPEEHNLKTVLANHVLIDMPNVIITPHNAFNTTEALHRILDTTVSNIASFADGKPTNVI